MGTKTSHVRIEVEKLRAIMIRTGLTKGLDHPETLMYSQKLDKYLNCLLEDTRKIKKKK
ncbi:aspartyl-phosphate phosphatase Spo0E family protein [Halalkalibacter sp. APA_J-10(15)]|uniref:aspartyl-phosphate phosphatase Spo0E family protein n=1 Tax=unclassified Halalkalibacter TaxID=2893063 RepID=UPI001FF5CA34|nr:aspartyl-phosphate phosphatase Spo0E family protein [Halalkalibacter sp. APA_J-10(15)]MCK0470121.1 aspartyl-phosphate phosphatase Spo0E family protein [Halalkalibacter sp. APA_J-10(15)]